MTLPDHGTLSNHPLPRLLLELAHTRFHGALSLQRERTTKRVLLRDGAPILAESNLASESLGVLLMDQGRLSREDYARVVARVQETNCKEGKALLELQLIAPKDLFGALKEQLRRRVLECFGWPNGDFTLAPNAEAPGEAQAFRLDPIGLVQDGLALHWSTERLLSTLGERLTQRMVPTPRLEKLRLRLRVDAGFDALVAALDGTRTLAEAVRHATTPDALAAAWVLEAAGGLSVVPDGSRASDETAPYDDDAAAAPEIEVVVAGALAEDAEVHDGTLRPAAARDALGAEAEALRKEILERHALRDELDHYALIGVAAKADAQTLKRAYFQAAKRYHPDALGRLGLGALRGAAGELFAAIAKVYAVLSDPRTRREYDAEAENGSQDDAQRLATAETLYRKGEILVRKGAFRDALQFLAPAVDLWPNDAAYRAALGWALYKQAKSDPAASREHLSAAVELDPKSAVAHYRLGVVLRALGERDAAARALARAKALDPQAAAG